MNIRISTLLLLFMSVAIVTAQRGGGGPGGQQPMTLGVHYDYFEAAETNQVLATFSRGGSSFRGGSPHSHMSMLNIALGVRFGGRQDSSEMRWRAGLVDALFHRKFLAIGFNILDLNKSAALEKDYQWAVVRLGIGKTIGTRNISITPLLLGIAGRSSWEIGAINYGFSNEFSDSALSGIEAGYSASVALQLGSRLSVSADYSSRTLIDGPEPKFESLYLEGRLRPGRLFGNHVQLYAGYREETLKFSTSPLQNSQNFITAGIRMTFVPERRKDNPWE